MSLGPASLALAASFAAISLAGILNVLPYQARVYQGLFKGDRHRRLPAQSGPDFCCVPLSYRHARSLPPCGRLTVLYFNLPRYYYYMHRAVPFYDAPIQGRLIFADQEKTEVEAIT